MSVNSYLTTLASNLILLETERNNLEISISTLEQRLKLYFGSSIKESFIFGSYSRGTILPRKVDENSDIDYMIVFDNIHFYKPQTYLNQLKAFAEHYYQRSEIHQDFPTIVLELNHIKIELVPAYKLDNNYYISDKNIDWMYTNPNDINKELSILNSANKSKIKPLIRLLKYWNINKANRFFESYNLEKRLISILEYSNIYCSSFEEYVKYAFEGLKRELCFDIRINNKLEQAIKDIDSAKLTECFSIEAAENLIKKLFPEV